MNQQKMIVTQLWCSEDRGTYFTTTPTTTTTAAEKEV